MCPYYYQVNLQRVEVPNKFHHPIEFPVMSDEDVDLQIIETGDPLKVKQVLDESVFEAVSIAHNKLRAHFKMHLNRVIHRLRSSDYS